MDNFFIELKSTLQKLLEWSEVFKSGKRDYKFDVDDDIYILSEKYNIDFKEGTLLLVYTLADYYCDAVKHDFEKIGGEYPVIEARDDIRRILEILELNQHRSLELPVELVGKLKKVFDWLD